MTRTARTKTAFTIMELLIVTIIIGIMAAFAIPAYEKAMGRQKVRRLMVTTNLIAGAQQIYKAKNGRYWCDFPSSCSDLNSINTNLGLNIVPESGVVYTTYAVPSLESTFFRVLIIDPLFSLDTSFPPLNTICTNATALDVCP